MAERYVLCLEERHERYADNPAHPHRVTEIWRMNKRGPGELGGIYDYIEAKITEGPHLNRNKVQWELEWKAQNLFTQSQTCLLYTSPSPRDRQKSRMPSSA